ncbi:acyltransferase PapA5 [Posidoniimonas corsicana]|uniref:Acyltransferase PapA5 n=1 Tax=Posidoniimonas corsicana TaxID=1938618 RepID=A0A5C5VA05_9BACT|nr:condensation domain-containing protein [Posidoniimonas corsicana]TWT35456.1 acyltransferase PapA5 [Posidoniimonas corsicana]
MTSITEEPAASPPARKQRLFPAHLAPIDKFLLDDDIPRYPMTYVIQLDCEGAFDRDDFEAALDGAIERHPYLTAKIGPGKRGMLSWIDGGADRPLLDWGGYDDPIVPPGGEPIDIRNEIGLRLWVRQDERRSKLVFQWHHSVTDGTGAFRFMGDLFVLYDQSKGGKKSKMLTLDPTLLRERRGRMARAYTAGNKRAVRAELWNQLREVFTRWAAPLAPRADKSAASFPGVMIHTLPKDETAQLRAVADKAHVMLNDLLLERLFQSLAVWNSMHVRRTSKRPLRVMMPTDLRESSETEMPAANMVGYTFISRKAEECTDSDALLRSIANETDQIKHSQRGKGFIDAITASEVVPWAIPLLLHRGWCLATAVLTNNGDPARRMNARLPRDGGRLASGGVVVTRFSGVPPLRERTNVVLSAMTYAKELTLSVRCSPQEFGDEESQQFLDLYLAKLRELLPQQPE